MTKTEAGCPTKYRPEYDQMLIDHMAEGMSFESFCAKIDVSRSTTFLWLKCQPTFSDAKNKGLEKAQYFWEKLGINGTAGAVPGFNVTGWIFNMKNRFNWRDRHEVEVQLPKPTIIERLDGRVIEVGIIEGEVAHDQKQIGD